LVALDGDDEEVGELQRQRIGQGRGAERPETAEPLVASARVAVEDALGPEAPVEQRRGGSGVGIGGDLAADLEVALLAVGRAAALVVHVARQLHEAPVVAGYAQRAALGRDRGALARRVAVGRREALDPA